MTTPDTPLLLHLEILVDQYGLAGVVEALATICQVKAQHISENWQGTNEQSLVKAWARVGDRLVTLANHLHGYDIFTGGK